MWGKLPVRKGAVVPNSETREAFAQPESLALFSRSWEGLLFL